MRQRYHKETIGKSIVGDAGEEDFATLIATALPSYYTVIHKPPKLQVYSEGRGIVLDTLIINTLTEGRLYGEKKTGNNGGNAHERAYKFLSPALKRAVREKYNTVEEPLWLKVKNTKMNFPC